MDTEAGEGGLLGIAVSPDYGSDGLVYAYLTSPTDNRIVRFRLGGGAEVVLEGLERESIHNGGRIAFGPDGKLYAGVGDAGDGANAQDLEFENGKILRMNPDGSVPEDNPFPSSRVWSLGHRNVQGLAWDRAGRLWASEFGQAEFDEVNLIRKGRNYGWPEVEGEGDTAGGRFTNPLVTWSTAESSPAARRAPGRTCTWRRCGASACGGFPCAERALGEPVALLDGRYGRLRTVVRAPDGTCGSPPPTATAAATRGTGTTGSFASEHASGA